MDLEIWKEQRYVGSGRIYYSACSLELRGSDCSLGTGRTGVADGSDANPACGVIAAQKALNSGARNLSLLRSIQLQGYDL